MQPFIHILNIRIPAYGLMILISLITTNSILFFLYTNKKALKSCRSYDEIILLEAYCFLFAILFAKILYIIIVTIKLKSQITINVLCELFSSSGFVFYGGLIGAIFGAYICKVIHNVDISNILDDVTFLLPLGHSLGRIGCFLAGCCYGIPYKGIFNIIFPINSFAPHNVRLFPIQLLESIILLTLSMIFFILRYKYKVNNLLVIYIFIYSLIRFFLEFLRGDIIRGSFHNLSTSQILSLSLILMIILIKIIKSIKKEEK